MRSRRADKEGTAGDYLVVILQVHICFEVHVLDQAARLGDTSLCT